LKSKIINMADKIKDADDQMLEALFRAEAIADDGFSHQVVRRIKRRLWVQRITLPAAAAIGAAISLKPLSMLVTMLFGFVASLPANIVPVSMDWLPPLPMIALGAMLLIAMLLGLRILEE